MEKRRPPALSPHHGSSTSISSKHLSHWIDNTADPLISPPKSPVYCSSSREFDAPIHRSAAGQQWGRRGGHKNSRRCYTTVGGVQRAKALLEIEVRASEFHVRDKQEGCSQHHAAAARDHLAMEVLYARGANVDLRDLVWVSPFRYAINTLTCV